MKVINISINPTPEERAEIRTILGNNRRKEALKLLGFIKEEEPEVTENAEEEEVEQNG